MFILMTNRTKGEGWDALRNLETCKGQEAAEMHFRLLKDPAILDALYLDKPNQIDVLGIVFVLPFSCSEFWNGA
ncbi:hypothetical protein [Thermicanus aegyptius]|jgi:hypothetical protein|uniref:hypothetical protein n=1 Tax=Thermicanus aegyptius TaxID=94009 RepID=UPI000406A64A|nr:hypothetical protein [Thermicanus aegyptius]